MIFFEPGDSGINSMLGQMMWFRRFCDGHGIAHDFAVDLDRSPRNIVTQSVHDLLLGPQPRLPTSTVRGRFWAAGLSPWLCFQ